MYEIPQEANKCINAVYVNTDVVKGIRKPILLRDKFTLNSCLNNMATSENIEAMLITSGDESDHSDTQTISVSV